MHRDNFCNSAFSPKWNEVNWWNSPCTFSMLSYVIYIKMSQIGQGKVTENWLSLPQGIFYSMPLMGLYYINNIGLGLKVNTLQKLNKMSCVNSLGQTTIPNKRIGGLDEAWALPSSCCICSIVISYSILSIFHNQTVFSPKQQEINL